MRGKWNPKTQRYEGKHGVPTEREDYSGCDYTAEEKEEMRQIAKLESEGGTYIERYARELGVDEFEYIATDDWYIHYDELSLKVSDIVRTSPDIWGLVKVGWLAKWITEATTEIITTFKLELLAGSIIALYAPITENGKVTSYALVWEREE